ILGDIALTSPTAAPAMMASGVCSAAVAAAPTAVGTISASVARKFPPPPDERRVGRLAGRAGTRSVLGGIGGWSPAAVQVDDDVVQREAQRVRLAEEGVLERRELVEQRVARDVAGRRAHYGASPPFGCKHPLLLQLGVGARDRVGTHPE